MNKTTPAKIRQWKDYKELCVKHEALNSALASRDIGKVGRCISDYELALGRLARVFAEKVWFKKDLCSVEHGEDGVCCQFEIGQDHAFVLETVAEAQGLDRNRTSKLMRANGITFNRWFCVNAARDPDELIEKLIDIQEAFSESHEFIRSCLAAGLAEALTQIEAEEN
jgi:hypothetical protein